MQINQKSIRLNLRFLTLTKIQSDPIRANSSLPLRMNSNKVLNLIKSKIRMIYIEFATRINPSNSNLGFIRIKKLARIHLHSEFWINSDWLVLSRIDF